MPRLRTKAYSLEYLFTVVELSSRGNAAVETRLEFSNNSIAAAAAAAIAARHGASAVRGGREV